jgi:DedD protein
VEDILLKQRLVGAIVLVSLGIIFIPMILSGGDQAGDRLTVSNIPQKPDKDFVSRIIPLDKQAPEPGPLPTDSSSKTVKPAPSKQVKVYKAPEVAKLKDAEPVKAAPKPSPKVVAKPVAKPAATAKKGWVAQVGSFSSKSNAYGLRDKLRKKGFTAFVDSIKNKGKTTYRVRIGPEAQKAKASEQLARATKITKTKGFVARYP